MKGFRLPEFDEDGKLKQQLYGETATFLQDGSILLTGLKIEMFRKGEVTARIYSPECAYDPNRKLAASTNHIRIVVQKAVLTGVETRTSSPIRMARGDDFQSVNVRGLYPAGEGASYAGGILSAGVDGIKVAEAVALAIGTRA